VWFDQSELRGGDAWDQSIRKQIRDCRLFVPIISAHTEARLSSPPGKRPQLTRGRTVAKGSYAAGNSGYPPPGVAAFVSLSPPIHSVSWLRK